MKKPFYRRTVGGATLALMAWLPTPVHAVETVVANPIGRVARMFNSSLVELEDRMTWVRNRIASLPEPQEHTLKAADGCRMARENPTAPDPQITLDLGKEYPLDQIYMIPAQREPAEPDGLFPRRFSLEASKTEDFSTKSVIYASSPDPKVFYPNPGLSPAKFSARGVTARYVRLTVQTGRNRGVSDLFALSELVVISGNRPISFGSKVDAPGSVTIPGLWAPEYLTDGRMPMGIWQSGATSENRGDLVDVPNPTDEVSWSLDLGRTMPLDHLVLFPYEISELSEGAVLPSQLSIWVSDHADGSEARQVGGLDTLKNEMIGKIPFVIPLHGLEARSVRITGNRAWSMGTRNIQGLSEIQAWSEGTNASLGKQVTRQSRGTATQVATLTDGFSSVHQIIGVDAWLSQLSERWRLEREIETLTPMCTQLAQESELNTTWGSAVILGLTFLIPVVIVERRRLISKNQLDMLRKRIASDLHDDIGSNLGSISLIARTAKKDLVRLCGPEEVVEDLVEVESIARESSLAMRDIVWLLERRQDSIGDLVQRMRETAGRLLREVDYTIECRSTKVASKLTLDAKRHLFLFYKEAVHNIVKHSRARNVAIRLADQGERLVLEVARRRHRPAPAAETSAAAPSTSSRSAPACWKANFRSNPRRESAPCCASWCGEPT
ncbi:MAG: histidine kinase [Luteolibacter sp.]